MAATVFEAFAATARARADAPFLHVEEVTAAAYGIAVETLSYAALLARVEQVAARYRAAGVGHGHRAGLLTENRPAFFVHWFALNSLGASVVPIHRDMRAAELEYLVGHSEIVLAVSLPDRAALLRDAARAAGRKVAIIGLEDEVDLPPLSTTAPHAGRLPGSDSECALLYTSGTTGRPKGCVLANDYYLRAGRWYAAAGGACALAPAGERMATPLPLTHMNAMAYSVMAMIVTGGCLIQLDRFHPETWWQSVRASGATVVHYLGVMPAMLLNAPVAPADRQHAVRFGFGAGVDRRHHANFEERFGFPLIEGWAMTETGAGAVVVANEEPRLVGQASLGRAGSAMQWRLVDEDGQDVPTGSNGELLVRAAGPDPRAGFFREYLKDAEATAAAWQGGWFHTGDLVRADDQGNLFFIDRKKNVIRRSGENISAVEVESVLATFAGVKAVAVAATPDALRGDEVAALVVTQEALDDAARADFAAALTRHALLRLSYFKAPGWVAFVDALPLTPSQKIARGDLRSIARGLADLPGTIDTRALKKRPAD
ncbi:MAG: AMP-binding protein [Burkholderiales bacterium]|nr:AMP-binding protein [Burkholderiales bacterium]